MIKAGVNVTGIKPEIVLAVIMAQAIYARHGAGLVITSALDGKHSRGSLHYSGNAIDLRTRHVSRDDAETIADELRAALGAQYDVVLEKDHIHVEFQPKA